MGSVFERVLGVTMLVVPVFVVTVFVVTVLGVFFMAFGAGRRIRRGIGRPDGCGVRQVGPEFGGSLAGMNMAVIIIMGRVVVMLVRRLVTLMVVIAGMAVVAEAVAIFAMVVRGVITVMVMRLLGLGEIRRAALDHAALHAFAVAAAARVAVARAAAVGAILGLLLGLAMGAFVGLDQRLAVGDRDLVIIRVDFAEGQKTVAVAAILDEGGLQRWLDARDLGEIDVSAQLLALGGLEIKLFDSIAADHDDPGLFRMGGIDQHFVGHFGTLDGGGRVSRCARMARPGDATVHLIRG